MMPPWQRHDLAAVRPGVVLPQTPAGRWLADGGMGVVCRSESAARVRLGVCLPRVGPGDEKPPRDACEVPPEALATVLPPLALSEVLPSAPSSWREGLAALLERGGHIGVHWRVFGSLSWQHRHGCPGFVNEATSDADLLLTPADPAQLDAALALLSGATRPPRLDGEVVFPGGLGVSWRELATGAARVLVKRLDGVDLMPTAALRALLLP